MTALIDDNQFEGTTRTGHYQYQDLFIATHRSMNASSDDNSLNLTCPSCHASYHRGSRFCSSCGHYVGEDTTAIPSQSIPPTPAAPKGDVPEADPLQPTPLETPYSVRHTLIILASGLLVWGAVILTTEALQRAQGRSKPTVPFSPASENSFSSSGEESSLGPSGDTGDQASLATKSPQEDPPFIVSLRAKANAQPEDIATWKELGAALVNLSHELGPRKGDAFAFEAIDVYRRIIEKAPNDLDSLRALGDLSFESRIFERAVHYYQKYLDTAPSDNGIRARLASTFTFLGRFDEAISLLQSILSQDPKNFHAHAYLAITYAQMGNASAALAAARDAYAFAPSEEAKQRMGEFVKSLESRTLEQPPRGEKAPANSGGTSSAPVTLPSDSPEVTTSDPELQAFVTQIRNHPIAGSRFVRATKQDGALLLFFREFPMESMPEMARNRFLDSLRGYPGLTGVRELVFIDAASGREMLRAAAKKVG